MGGGGGGYLTNQNNIIALTKEKNQCNENHSQKDATLYLSFF